MHPHESPNWVDPKVFGITSVFHTDVFVSYFLNRVPILKASARGSLLSFGPCLLIDCVHKERSSIEPVFFFMYSFLFSDLHVSLPFDTFMVDVLQALNVVQSQLHPNTWRPCKSFVWYAKLLAFVLLQLVFFIFIRLIRPTLLAGIRWSAGRATCCSKPPRPPTKTLKRDSLKCLWSVRVCRTFSMQSASLGFLCHRKIKDWPRSINPSAGEREICALFDSLPRKFPLRHWCPFTHSSIEKWPLRVC